MIHGQIHPPLLPGQHLLADDSPDGIGPCHCDLLHWYYREPVELDPPHFLCSSAPFSPSPSYFMGLLFLIAGYSCSIHSRARARPGSPETGPSGNFIPERERSDVVHDLLAFLAEREMNKEKQQEIRSFLGWLEGYLGAKVEDLTPKTKVQSYYEHDYESLLAALKKNRKKLAIDPARREPGETLRAEFEGSLAKLLPLRERIRQTDGLIDAVVYRLYGLTEEEIGIVEGKKGDS